MQQQQTSFNDEQDSIRQLAEIGLRADRMEGESSFSSFLIHYLQRLLTPHMAACANCNALCHYSCSIC